MKQRGAYQKRKELANRISNAGVLIVSIVLFLALIVSIAQNIYAVQEIKNQTLCEYFGGYTYTLSKTRHNTNYLFTLENGEKIVVSGQLLESKDAASFSSELIFRYSSAFSIIPWGGHIGVSIENSDGSIVILAEDISKADLEARIPTYLALACLILVIPLFLAFSWVIENKKLIKRIFHK